MDICMFRVASGREIKSLWLLSELSLSQLPSLGGGPWTEVCAGEFDPPQDI